eukprot:TRINITY_DN29308_c0_g1_i1.p1 TRINITY_DN29308_c0_g1~~TRINITY_DN29308_c0_g1_i1.p1  ORF type:complete len:227 (+),score=35.40 TRINITY_DN29308_c0_g1_i1:57-737(+)
MSCSSFFTPDPAPLSLNRVVSYLEKSDARDKVVKAIQNFLKYLVWRHTAYNQKDLAKKWKTLASVLSEYRSILKFGKPLKALKDIIAIGRPADVADSLEVATNSCDIVYKLYDNVEFLSKYKFFGYNPDRMESISKAAQFWTYFTQLILDVVEWRKLREKVNSAEKEKKIQKLRLELVKDISDFLRVLPPYLRRFIAFPTHDGFSALMGTIAGAAGAYSVWLKTPK